MNTAYEIWKQTNTTPNVDGRIFCLNGNDKYWWDDECLYRYWLTLNRN